MCVVIYLFIYLGGISVKCEQFIGYNHMPQSTAIKCRKHLIALALTDYIWVIFQSLEIIKGSIAHAEENLHISGDYDTV